MTPEKGKDFPSMARTFRAFTKTKNAPIVNAIRRTITAIRTDAKNRIPEDGLGRAIWGQNVIGLNKLIKRVVVRTVGDGFTGGLEVKGLAGLIEKGGRTASHPISAWRGAVLARAPGFFVRGTGGVSKAFVKHPGGPVAKKARALEAVEAARPRFFENVQQALAQAMEEAARNA